MPGYEELESKIIQTNMCTVCGTCISACPLYYIQMVEGKPKRPKKKAACKNCSVCFDSCYRTSGEIISDGSIGQYLRVVSAKYNGSGTYQDGGIVTAVLRYAHDMQLIDGAVLTRGSRMPMPFVATCAEDFNACAMTRYGVSPVLMNIRTAIVEHELDKLAVVGTPCHIQSVSHLQQANPELSSAMVLSIGLFCSENFAHSHIAELMDFIGLEEEDVEKVTVLNGRLVIQARDRNTSIPVSDLKTWVPNHCLFCKDYTSELADISVGSEGSPEGWSTVVIRTKKGDEIFSELERTGQVSTSSIPVNELERLMEASERKRKRATIESA
ncbi:MAG: hypothetical protein GQ469_00675 [Methanosarcinales archaeon]|nr:hypothetical protein [Methanosarcinales archaeon]